MDINKNIDLLNTFFIFKRFTKDQRIEAANIAKVSKNFEYSSDQNTNFLSVDNIKKLNKLTNDTI